MMCVSPYSPRLLSMAKEHMLGTSMPCPTQPIDAFPFPAISSAMMRVRRHPRDVGIDPAPRDATSCLILILILIGGGQVLRGHGQGHEQSLRIMALQ